MVCTRKACERTQLLRRAFRQILARRWQHRWDTPALRHMSAAARPLSIQGDDETPYPDESAGMIWGDGLAVGRRVLADSHKAQGALGGGRCAPPGSLEEVFSQAAAAAPILFAKAASLARSSGGELWSRPTASDPQIAASSAGSGWTELAWFAVAQVGGSEARGGSAARAQVSLKPWGRAVEKVVRCYGGDPARLLDCCRCAAASF